MSKLRVITLVPLLTVAVLSACTPSGDLDIESAALSDISVEDAAAATVKSMSIEGAVQATLQAMAPDATETPTPQPIGQAPTPDNQSVSNPTVVINIAATSTVTESTGAVTPTATVVIEVPVPTSTVTSGSVSSLTAPVVQVATPTSIVSASIGTVTATAAVTPTIVPSPVPVPTPIPEPTATPTPTPVPYSYNIIEGTTPIGTSGYNYTLLGFSVEDYDLISDLVSTQIKWGDSNDYQQVSVMQGTGEILANHTFTSGGSFYGEIRLVSNSTGEVLASQTITIVMNLGDIPTAVPTISVIDVATLTSTVSAGLTPTATAVVVVVQPTSTPTCDMSGWVNVKVNRSDRHGNNTYLLASEVKTWEQIRAEQVEQYPTLTKLVNGVSSQLDETEYNETIDEWATVNYRSQVRVVPGATVQVTGGLTASGSTDSEGNFLFNVCKDLGETVVTIKAIDPDYPQTFGMWHDIETWDGHRPLVGISANVYKGDYTAYYHAGNWNIPGQGMGSCTGCLPQWTPR